MLVFRAYMLIPRTFTQHNDVSRRHLLANLYMRFVLYYEFVRLDRQYGLRPKFIDE